MNTPPLYPYSKEKLPDGLVPFGMTPDYIWEALAEGTINAADLNIFTAAWRRVNPYKGYATLKGGYGELGTMLGREYTPNYICKSFKKLLQQKFLYFEPHKGSTTLQFTVDKFPMIDKQTRKCRGWVNVQALIDASVGIGESTTINQTPAQPPQKSVVVRHKSERSKGGGFEAIGAFLPDISAEVAIPNTDTEM